MQRRALLVTAVLVLSLLACAEERDTSPATATTTAEAPAEGAQASTPAPSKPATARPARREPPLPAFEGPTLGGGRLSLSSLIGRRALLFFFNPEAKETGEMGDAVALIADERGDHNFEIVGVAMSGAPEAGQAFLAERGLDIQTLYDPQARLIGQILRRAAPGALILVDSEGYLTNATTSGGPAGADEPAETIAATLRDWLRLPGEPPEVHELGARPKAPDIEALQLDSDENFQLASRAGKPLVVVFFWHTCPHCHEALDTIGEALETIPASQRPEVLGISVEHRPDAVREAVKEGGWDFLTVLFDPTSEIREAYATGPGVPVVYMLDAQHRITSRVSGWREDRDPPLTRMRLAQLAGAPVPMLLHSTGYSGDEFCGVCHGSEHDTFELTNHAAAFDTLVKHGEDANPECVGCHVVGYEQPGGWSLARRQPDLEGVGCETCHGRGGPHLSPDHVQAGNYEPVCVTCHNPTHSLGFEYASFLPKVSHAATLAIFDLPPAQRAAALAERRAPRTDLLPTTADFVGSDACQSCHAQEFETWSGQAHAKAFATLESKGEAGNEACVTCHTTGLGKTGGYAMGGGNDPNLAAVGCESCHGPGSEHVAEGAARRGTILSLGDKCDSCVILKICGSCHDDANDPGFRFEVQEKIDRQRHGTIEPSTPQQAHGHGLPATAEHGLPATAELGLLERAWTEPRS